MRRSLVPRNIVTSHEKSEKNTSKKTSTREKMAPRVQPKTKVGALCENKVNAVPHARQFDKKEKWRRGWDLNPRSQRDRISNPAQFPAREHWETNKFPQF